MSDYIPQFEQFPNEILLEIFDYMQLSDLIRAFYNLNQRFNSILFSSNIYLRILYPDDIEQKILNQKFLLQSLDNHRYLSRLRLTHDRNIPSEKFLPFSLIRSLILDTPTSKLLEIITPERFPHLEYLRLGYLSPQVSLTKLHQNIFSNAFPYLRKCSLNNLTDDQTWTGSPAIRTLGVWSDNPHLIIARILLVLMHLHSLHLFLTWPMKSSLLDEHLISPHVSLHSLRLHLNGQWSNEKLDSFLAYIPTVKYLSLYSSYFNVHMVNFQWNFQYLATIFLCRLPNLSLFDCELIFQMFKSFDFHSIASFHTCFHSIQFETYIDDDRCIRLYTK